jgi:hypothetical protein
MGFVHKGKEYLTYNHMDSYPTQLGVDFMRTVKSSDLQILRAYVESLVLVDSDASPSLDELKQMVLLTMTSKFADEYRAPTGVDPLTWYDLLNDYQGNLAERLRLGIRWWLDDDTFQYSQSCEWCYVANLDTEMLEMYTSHHSSPWYPRGKLGGRYVEAAKKDPTLVDFERSKPCGLIDKISFDELRATPEYALVSYCKRINDRY